MFQTLLHILFYIFIVYAELYIFLRPPSLCSLSLSILSHNPMLAISSEDLDFYSFLSRSMYTSLRVFLLCLQTLTETCKSPLHHPSFFISFSPWMAIFICSAGYLFIPWTWSSLLTFVVEFLYTFLFLLSYEFSKGQIFQQEKLFCKCMLSWTNQLLSIYELKLICFPKPYAN